MKKLTYIFILIIVQAFVACSDNDTVASNQLLNEFSLSVGDSQYHATIDKSTNKMIIGGIEYGNTVDAFNYQLADGATIEFDFESYVHNWPEILNFEVTNGNDTEQYSICLTSFKGDSEESSTDDKLILFEDNFNQDGRVPDPDKWVACNVGTSDWARYLSESNDQAYVEDGKLVLIAEKVDGEYKTGGIQTKGLASFQDARVEVSARFTKTAQGGWPAIWLMPQTPKYNGWPNCGEIDIMEQLNHDNEIYQTIHSNYKDNLKMKDPVSFQKVGYNENEFNTYAVEMRKDEIVFFINDKEYLHYPNLHLDDEAEKMQWPFDTDFYLILNYAVGGAGTWPGAIIDTELPAKMEIDWVKVTQLEDESSEKTSFVVGYLPLGDHKFDSFFDKLKWNYLTHIDVSFASVTSDGTLDTSDLDGNIDKVVTVAHAHNVKVLLSVNKAGVGEFDAALSKKESRDKVVKAIIDYTRDKGLDGFDIDYEEYSTWKTRFPDVLKFVKALHEAKDEDMLMTCAVVSGWLNYTTEWKDYFDFINIMSYDHGSNGSKTPIQHASYEAFVNDLNYWVNTCKVPKNKLVGGLPFYGFTWDNFSSTDNGGTAIRYYDILTKYPGVEDLENIDHYAKTYYNGKETIRKKCNFVKDNDFGGVMIWQLFQDSSDEETCLMNVIGEVINK